MQLSWLERLTGSQEVRGFESHHLHIDYQTLALNVQVFFICVVDHSVDQMPSQFNGQNKSFLNFRSKFDSWGGYYYHLTFQRFYKTSTPCIYQAKHLISISVIYMNAISSLKYIQLDSVLETLVISGQAIGSGKIFYKVSFLGGFFFSLFLCLLSFSLFFK